MASRYVGGAWGSPETVLTQSGAIDHVVPAIDDQGNALLATWDNNVSYGFTYAAAGKAWAALKKLSDATYGATPMPSVAIDPGTGKAAVTFHDQAAGRKLRGVFYDPTTHALSAPFTIEDPAQSGSEIGQASIDGDGTLTVLFTQQPTTLPQGSNSSNGSLLYANTCR
jgi:hypothetical protein